MDFRTIWVAFAASLALPGVAVAQALPPLPSQAQQDALLSLFRVAVAIQTPTGVFTDSYGIDRADVSKNFLDPNQLLTRYGSNYNDSYAVQGSLDFRGVQSFASYDANSTTLRLRVPAFDEPNAPYVLVFTGATRRDSYDQFKSYVSKSNIAEGLRLLRLLLAALSRQSPIDPLAGNPGSIQGALVRSGLDLSAGNSAIEQADTPKSAPGDPWMVGGAFTTYSVGSRYHGRRFDGRIQRSFRLSEGGRSLLKFELPISYSETNGARAASIQVGVGAEFPVVAGRWSLEPRAGYAITASDQLGSIGHMGSGSITSRYVLPHVGRGRVIIGNMVGYVSTLSTAFTGWDFDPGIQNTVIRNGVAYELPLKARAGGRNLSLRASYAVTNLLGSALYANTYHEVAVSFGVRGREDGARNSRDLIRVNVSGTKAGAYKSLTAGVGFRF